MEIIRIPIDELTPDPNNAKQHPRWQVEQIVASIEQFGNLDPIGVWGDNNLIVEGHGRYEALKLLDYNEAECIRLDWLTEEERRAYALAHNKLTMNSDFDSESLNINLDLIKEIDMSAFGFDIKTVTNEPEEIIEDEVPEEVETRCKLGDVWLLGNHRLICGDCTDENVIDKLIDGNFIRMTVTSPPYGVGKDYEEKGIEPWRNTIGGVINAIKGKTLIICWNIGDLYSTGTQFTEPTGAYSISMMNDAGYGMLYNRIWKKPGANFGGNNPYYTVTTKPAQDFEYLYAFAEKESEYHLKPLKDYLFGEAAKSKINNAIIKNEGGPGAMCGHWFTEHQWAFIDEKNYKLIQSYCRKKNIKAFEKDYEELKDEYLRKTVFSHRLSDEEFSNWGLYGVWEFNTVSKRLGGHAAAFPLELPIRYIKVHSYENDNVLDPFGGTGTTLIACEQLNRKCFMCELDPHYCDVIIQRWEDFTGKKAVLVDN